MTMQRSFRGLGAYCAPGWGLGIKAFIGLDGTAAELGGVTVRWQPTTVKLPDGTTVVVEGVVPSEARCSAASVPIGDP